jgi:hypothetical protein
MKTQFVRLWDHGGRTFSYQMGRVRARSVAFSRAIASAAFWLLALVAYAQLEAAGLRVFGILVLASWVVLSLPAVVFQLALVLDVLNYVLTRRVLIYPFLQSKYDIPQAKGHKEPWGMRVWRGIVTLVVITSPLSGIATWFTNVLSDIPTEAYVPVVSDATLGTAAGRGDRRAHARRSEDKRMVTVANPFGIVAPYWRKVERANYQGEGKFISVSLFGR